MTEYTNGVIADPVTVEQIKDVLEDEFGASNVDIQKMNTDHWVIIFDVPDDVRRVLSVFTNGYNRCDYDHIHDADATFFTLGVTGRGQEITKRLVEVFGGYYHESDSGEKEDVWEALGEFEVVGPGLPGQPMGQRREGDARGILVQDDASIGKISQILIDTFGASSIDIRNSEVGPNHSVVSFVLPGEGRRRMHVFSNGVSLDDYKHIHNKDAMDLRLGASGSGQEIMQHIVENLEGYYLPTDANDAGKKFDNWKVQCDLTPDYDDDEHYDGGQHRP